MTNRKQRRAAKSTPNAVESGPGPMLAQAVQLHRAGKLAEAARAYRKIIAIKADTADAHYNLGLALKGLGKLDQAVESYRRAISCDPGMVQAHSNLGNLLRDLDRLGEAVEACRTATRLKPDFVNAQLNLGNALLDRGDLDEAIAAFDRAIALAPDLAEAHWGAGFASLLEGDFKRGWREHEWRWRRDGVGPHPHPEPQWDGSDLGGRAILVHCEQGLGDSIQFVRYLPLVKAKGAEVTLLCPPRLIHLFKAVPGVDHLVGERPAGAVYHRQIPLLSLPFALGTIPADIPYLAADPDRVRHWRRVIGETGRKVGIAWQGNPKAAAEKGRSPPLAGFAPLGRLPGIRLISLQKNDGVEQLKRLPPGMTVETLGRDFDGGSDAFADTAAVMMALDLIVTSDTAVAHLAGALGRPVWTVLKRVPDWRWMMDREETPWYPTMRLFRQSAAGDWNGVMTRVAESLAAWPASACASRPAEH